jgi:hypothetical protein
MPMGPLERLSRFPSWAGGLDLPVARPTLPMEPGENRRSRWKGRNTARPSREPAMASFVEFRTTDQVEITINVEQIVYFHGSSRDEEVTMIGLSTSAVEGLHVQASYPQVRSALHERT